jgi:hypothetical protein
MDITPDRRWKDIDRHLEPLASGKVIEGDPVSLEEQLLQEQDELEWKVDEEYFRQRDLDHRMQ